jgi:hypothetical protein
MQQGLVTLDRVAQDGMKVRASAGAASFRRRPRLEELATDTDSQIITGVEVTNSGGDQGKMAPMVEQHQQRYEQTPDEMLVDGGFVKKDEFDAHTPRPDDSPAVAEWRTRMATNEAKEIYKERAATAECVNAIARNRGLQQFRVRGSPKVKAVVLWYVLAHNLMRAVALRAQQEIEME